MPPLQLGTQEYVNTQKNLLAIVASQPFYTVNCYNTFVQITGVEKRNIF